MVLRSTDLPVEREREREREMERMYLYNHYEPIFIPELKREILLTVIFFSKYQIRKPTIDQYFTSWFSDQLIFQ